MGKARKGGYRKIRYCGRKHEFRCPVSAVQGALSATFPAGQLWDLPNLVLPSNFLI